MSLLITEDLKNQKTFHLWDENIWLDNGMNLMISFSNVYGPTLYTHNEVDGRTGRIKVLKDLEDLKRVYEAITDEKFE
jgi:hypothetical protein